jgi:hypothetical protein
MAAPTNTYLTTSGIGIREDLSDIIYRISPTLTPLMNLCAKSKATNTLHEWQVQELAAAAVNKQAEGDDASAKSVTPTVRLKSYTQISTKTVFVSGTNQAVTYAGVKDQLANQLSLASFELKRDMEYGLLQGVASAGTTGSSPRQTNTMGVWVNDNNDNGGGAFAAGTYLSGGQGTPTGTNNTDGTQRAFTEAQLKNVLQKCFTAGGEPDTILLGAAAKQAFSTFTGNATRFDKSEDAKLYASVDVYVSDFGELKAVPSRFQRSRDVFVLQSDKWALAYLRPFQQIELAPTGDAMKRELVVEYALECRAPKANGAVYDIQ